MVVELMCEWLHFDFIKAFVYVLPMVSEHFIEKILSHKMVLLVGLFMGKVYL